MIGARRAPLIASYSKKEYGAFLRKELLEYEASINDMTERERVDLHGWVRDGNRVVDNPYGYCEEDGLPMDFISAARLDEDILAYFKSLGFSNFMDESDAGDLPF